jgi:phospholipase C
MRSSFLAMVRPELGQGRQGFSRRAFIGGSAGVAMAGVLGPSLRAGASSPGARSLPRSNRQIGLPNEQQLAALNVLGRDTLRLPGSVPDPSLLPGTETLAGIDHIVVLMLENHSFDNILGMLGRGDGWPLGADGLPTSTQPYIDGRLQHAFRMPTTCQLPHQPSQEWATSNLAYNSGNMNGFVRSPVSPQLPGLNVGGVAMGYWTAEDLPFTYSLASTFPIADRWFQSMLGQTDPNRRYLVAATSSGMTDDISTSVTVDNAIQDALLATPTPTIFDLLSAFNISWTDYVQSFPLGATAELDPVLDTASTVLEMKPVAQFYVDAAHGNLPAFSIVEPDYSTQSQENPQNMAVGDGLLADVVNAIGDSPAWKRTLLIFTYDEHGGYYDHVAPPVALAPDAILPVVSPGESLYEGFERYGFRVPGVLVSPYAKKDYVSHVVFDHTSVLALVERKWNLPALTFRDANANDLTDMLDLEALADGSPTFPSLPKLAAPGNTPAALRCSVTGPGTIPPHDTVSPAPV